MTTRDFEVEKSASRKEEPRLRDKRLAFRDGTEGPISREKEDPRRVMGPRGDSTRKEVLVSLPKFHMVASCLHTFMTIFDLAKITNDQFSAPNGVNITNDRFLLRMASWFLIL